MKRKEPNQPHIFVTLVAPLLLLHLYGCSGSPDATHLQASQKSFAEGPIRITSFGDSISSGIFADTQLGDSLTKTQENRILRMIFTLKDFSESRTLGNRAFQREAGAEAFTAFTGEFSYSHKNRIKNALGTEVLSDNLALTGSVAPDLDAQLDGAASLYATRPPADYVTITIGSNDFCDNTPLSRFRDNVRERFERVRALHPRAGILVVRIPDIVSLLSAEYLIGFRAFDSDIACRELHKITGICQKRGIALDSPPSLIERAQRELRAYNTILEEETARIAGQEGHDAVFANPQQLEGAVPAELLAVDCYHPGRKGQEALANATWHYTETLELGNRRSFH